MKRDMDLCRAILLALEKIDESRSDLKIVQGSLSDYSAQVVSYHCGLLSQAGLIKRCDFDRTMDIPNPSYRAPPGQFDQNLAYSTVHTGTDTYCELTWDGHDYLEMCRDMTRFEKAKGIAHSVGGLSFDAFKSTLGKLMQQGLESFLG